MSKKKGRRAARRDRGSGIHRQAPRGPVAQRYEAPTPGGSCG